MRILYDTVQRPVATQLLGHNFEILNPSLEFEQPEDILEYFSLVATQCTRLSRRNYLEDEFTAPMVLRRLQHPFVLCEVTVTIDFQTDWDQGGLVIFAGGHPAQCGTRQTLNQSLRGPYIVVDPTLRRGPDKWARVALELMAGELNISTVVANQKCGADWASTPAMLGPRSSQLSGISLTTVRLKLERVGRDLWIWYMNQQVLSDELTIPTPETISRQWRKCREVINFFNDEAIKGGMWVGCYASRPMQSDVRRDGFSEEGLFAEFEDLTIL